MTSMLVACGYSSTQLKKKVPEALSKLGNPALAIVTLGRRSLLSSGPLRAWLEEQLAADEVGLGPGSGDNGDHTFKDLYDKKEIALYVIAMDLATGQPIAFSPHLPPDAAVGIARTRDPVAVDHGGLDGHAGGHSV